MTIKYRYALNSTGNVIDILEINESARRDGAPFLCISCGNELIPRLGRVRTKHFAHKVQIDCSKETYLHKLAKRVFKDEYSKCISENKPFHLKRTVPVYCNFCKNEYDLKCEEGECEEYDLTKYFEICTEEGSYGSFRADVLLSSVNRDEVLFVEIVVAHECDEKKINAGYRIVEIRIADELDIDTFRNHSLNANDDSISLHNFRNPMNEKEIHKGDCGKKVISVFVIYASQKSIMLKLEPCKVKGFITGKKGSCYVELIGAVDRADPTKIYRQTVRKAYFKGVKVKNCFLCRYHGGDGVINAIFCKFRTESFGSNEAVDCSYFKPFRNMNECEEVDIRNDEYVKNNSTNMLLKRILR